jgi:hypothetical protein
MVRLHVVYDEVVERPAAEGVVDIFKKPGAYRGVRRVEEDGFFIQQEVRVIGDAAGNGEIAFEQRKAPVVPTDPDNVRGYISGAVHGSGLGEVIFSNAADRADKVRGDVFPFGSGGNAAVGVAFLFVVLESAYTANIFGHDIISFLSVGLECIILTTTAGS